MDQIIKKKLARNWFKTLQEVLCKEIEELEGRSNLFRYKNWERGKKTFPGFWGLFKTIRNCQDQKSGKEPWNGFTGNIGFLRKQN